MSSSPTCILMVDPAAEVHRPNYQFKAVFNDRGILIAPGTVQHNTVRAPGIFYEHDHQGNALAAMIYNATVEVRGHRDFTPERVRGILRRMAMLPALAPLSGFAVTYRGLRIGAFGSPS